MAIVHVDAYRKRDGTRVSAHVRHTDAVPSPPGYGSGGFGTTRVAKSTIADARKQGRAVLEARKGKTRRARIRKAKLQIEAKVDAPQTDPRAAGLHGTSEETREDFEIRQARFAREIGALDKAIKGPRTSKSIKAISRRGKR